MQEGQSQYHSVVTPTFYACPHVSELKCMHTIKPEPGFSSFSLSYPEKRAFCQLGTLTKNLYFGSFKWWQE